MIFYFLLFFAMLAWGETWISTKILNRYLNSQELIFWRYLFTKIGMIFILNILKINFKESKKELLLALLCTTILVIYNNTFFLGTKYGLASFGGVFVTTINPILTFLFVALLNKKLFSKIEIIGLFIGIIGAIFMLKLWNLDFNKIFSLGNIYFLLAAITWPILTILSSKQKMKSAILF